LWDGRGNGLLGGDTRLLADRKILNLDKSDSGETPLGQLSQRILLTGASTTYTVKKLEQRGLIVRSREIDPLQPARQLDATLHGEVTEMVVTHGSVAGVAHGFLIAATWLATSSHPLSLISSPS
jgi:hypothetical protein